MSWDVTRDTLHRTAKLLLDSGKARTPEEARAYLESMVLQVAVGREIGGDLAAQAALLTVVNAGHRAFLGGVHVLLEDDAQLTVPWAADLHGVRGHRAVRRAGATGLNPTGRPSPSPGQPRWSATSCCTSPTTVGPAASSKTPMRCSKVVASRRRGSQPPPWASPRCSSERSEIPCPGRRDVGVSLWRPDLDWRAAEAVGPALQYLPASLWLLGLGHLGQAYAWVMGMLPYAHPADVRLGLIDYDRVVAGNTATQLLVGEDHIDDRKTRVVASALERLGFATVIVERAFDGNFHPDVSRREPTIALAGFDSRDPRLLLGDDRLTWVVDGGLGSGAVEYLDVVVNTFPASEDPAVAFPPGRPRATPLPEAYEAEIANRVEKGRGEDAARCGLLDIVGVTIGAAFVGAFAASLVVSDVLRLLHGGHPFAVVHVDLRHPENLQTVPNSCPGAPNPIFTTAQHS